MYNAKLIEAAPTLLKIVEKFALSLIGHSLSKEKEVDYELIDAAKKLIEEINE